MKAHLVERGMCADACATISSLHGNGVWGCVLPSMSATSHRHRRNTPVSDQTAESFLLWCKHCGWHRVKQSRRCGDFCCRGVAFLGAQGRGSSTEAVATPKPASTTAKPQTPTPSTCSGRQQFKVLLGTNGREGLSPVAMGGSNLRSCWGPIA